MKIKDGRTRLAYKSEHVVDMNTGVVVAAEIYAADQADPATMKQSLEAARANVEHAKAVVEVESNEHACETGALRRVRLRGRENVKKRYLAHIAGLNLAIVLRKALGAGKPRGAADARKGLFVLILVIWTAITTMLRRLLAQVRDGICRWSSAGQNCIGLFGMKAACSKALSSTGC